MKGVLWEALFLIVFLGGAAYINDRTPEERAAGSEARPRHDGGHTARSPSTPVFEDAETLRWLTHPLSCPDQWISQSPPLEVKCVTVVLR